MNDAISRVEMSQSSNELDSVFRFIELLRMFGVLQSKGLTVQNELKLSDGRVIMLLNIGKINPIRINSAPEPLVTLSNCRKKLRNQHNLAH